MRNGRYATVDTDAMMKMGTSGRIPVPASVLSDLENGRPELVHDPATGMRISRSPMARDLYDELHVFVAESGVSPAAGEGLFASRQIVTGQLICLFNGVRISKMRSVIVRPDTDEWSDYRLTLDREIDLDIPEYETTLKNYSATLGHKACHSFDAKNAKFEQLYHPRFGLIMSIVATRDIVAGEEVLVSYNYDIPHAPAWYREQWFEYLRSSVGWSEERIEKWCVEQTAKTGYAIEKS